MDSATAKLASTWDRLSGPNRCANGRGPSTLETLVIVVCGGFLAFTTYNRVTAPRKDWVRYGALLLLGLVDILAFVVYFQRYRHCDALKGWLVWVLASALVALAAYVTKLEAADNYVAPGLSAPRIDAL